MRRTIQRLFTGTPVTEGAGVRLRRMFGYNETALFDPFLMLDDFRSDTPEHFLKGFPWHPHRGIETITYVLKGDVEHGDSLGHSGTISSGDVQWMTAGSGIIHQEMPKGDGNGSMHGFQLWANLPARNKMIHPKYRDITGDRIPTVTRQDGATVKVVAGEVDGVHGPMDDIVIDPLYLDCTVPAGTECVFPVNPGYTVFLFVFGGAGRVDDTEVRDGTVVLLDDGDEVAATAGDEPLRFLLLSGKPLGEPVAWRGPIVMNTREELDLAFDELSRDNFVKHD